MALGIWTAAANPITKVIAFGDLFKTFNDKIRPLAVAVGPHVKFNNLGCYPVLIVPAPIPSTDADALLRGIPVGSQPEVVLALAAGAYTVYCPYENLSLITSEGTLT